MRHDGKNERKRVRLLVSVDVEDDETKEINTIYQLLRTHYANRNLTVGGVRETKDQVSRNMSPQNRRTGS